MAKIIVSYCMTCGKIKYPHDEDWEYPHKLDYKALDGIELAHGYCDPCGEKAIQETLAKIAKAKAVQNDAQSEAIEKLSADVARSIERIKREIAQEKECK